MSCDAIIEDGPPPTSHGYCRECGNGALLGVLCDGLTRDGVPATIEYPGFLDVRLGPSYRLAVGFSNGPLGADLVDDDGGVFASWEKGDSETEWQAVRRFVAEARKRVEELQSCRSN